MTRIGLISDTHLRNLPESMTRRLAEAWAGVSQIWHAGDVIGPGVINDLIGLGLGPVFAVAGNMDGLPLAQELPRKIQMTVAGKKFGLIHGWGSPVGLPTRVKEEFPGADGVVFGHSHRPTNIVKEGVHLLNPGSATRNIMGRATVAVLTVEEEISLEIIKL